MTIFGFTFSELIVQGMLLFMLAWMAILVIAVAWPAIVFAGSLAVCVGAAYYSFVWPFHLFFYFLPYSLSVALSIPFVVVVLILVVPPVCKIGGDCVNGWMGVL
jgi:hypothetical protein